MRIAVFVEYFPPKLGSDRRIFEIMKRLSQKHEIHFIVFPPIRTLLDPQTAVRIPHFQQRKDIENHDGITGHFVSIPRKIAFIWQRSYIIAYLLTSILVLMKITRIFGKLKPEVLVLNYPSPYTGLLGFTEGKLWRKPVLLDFNDLIAEYTIALLGIKKNSFIATLLIFIQRYIVIKSNKVTAPTRFIGKYVDPQGTKRQNIVLIPNGADTKKFDPCRYRLEKERAELDITKEKICLYCGRLDSWAGTAIILKLREEAERRRLNVRFILAGSGQEALLPMENTSLLGEVPYEKIPQLLSTADVILVPFPNNEVSHAASPLKLFEGMSMQKLVIASRISGIEEVVSDGDNGLLANPDDIEEWSTKLQIALQSEELMERVGLRARQTIQEKYDWTLLANQFEDVLSSIAS